MAIKINASIGTINDPSKTDKSKGPLAQNLERLSSGKRVNKAADDAAAMAIAVRFAAQIAGTQQSYRNVNDGISLAQTGEAAVGELGQNVQRIRELAVQSANSTLSDDDRASLQAEVSSLQSEISRITGSTKFNGVSLLDNNQSLEFQVGPNAGDTISTNTADLQGTLNGLGVGAIDISTAAGASSALSVADNALTEINNTRSTYGAIQNRFESAGRNLLNVQENLEASRSRIEDADYASETSNLSANMIRQQAQNAMTAQANASRGLVLTLLGD